MDGLSLFAFIQIVRRCQFVNRPDFICPIQKRAIRESPLRLINLPINLVMTADIEQYDLLVSNEEGQGDAIAIGEAYSMTTGELAG